MLVAVLVCVPGKSPAAACVTNDVVQIDDVVFVLFV